jgi:DNA-binding SARP family transcriptional activator
VGPSEVEVAVLGPIEIRDTAEPFRRGAARELVVYLAFHRQGATNDDWADALWPSSAVVPSTIHSTASDARRAMGSARAGTGHLSRAGRRLRLAETVGTDVERFSGHISLADPVGWIAALTLIRGRPFSGLRRSDWAVFDGTQARIESMVAETALQAAEFFTARHQGRGAEWCVRRALLACPYDERLYRALLVAVEAQGSRVGLRAAMTQVLRLAGDGGGTRPRKPWGEDHLHLLHPATTALFHDLLDGSPAAGGHLARL